MASRITSQTKFVRVVDPQSVHYGERVKVLAIEGRTVRIESSGGGVPTERTWFERHQLVAIEPEELISEITQLRQDAQGLMEALKFITSLPPGSQGAYSKYVQARCRASEAIAVFEGLKQK